MGKAEFTLQQYEPAADALGQVQGVNSENAEASYWLARTYQALGAEAYAQLEESFPDSWRTHQLRAEGFEQDRNALALLHHVARRLAVRARTAVARQTADQDSFLGRCRRGTWACCWVR